MGCGDRCRRPRDIGWTGQPVAQRERLVGGTGRRMAARLGGRLLVLVSSCPVKGEVQASGGARSTVPDHLLSSAVGIDRSEEHTSELQSLMRISYAVFCLK